MQSQVKLTNMVVQCSACTTVQGSSVATIENCLHRDCLQVTDEVMAQMLTPFFTESHC